MQDLKDELLLTATRWTDRANSLDNAGSTGLAVVYRICAKEVLAVLTLHDDRRTP